MAITRQDMPPMELRRETANYRGGRGAADARVGSGPKVSAQPDLVPEERFRITLRRPAFHPAQPRESKKSLLVEPMPRLLGAEMLHQQLDLLFHHRLRHRDIDIRLAHVTVPFRNFIFQDQVIAKCVPRMPCDFAMVLMSVITTVRQNDIGCDACLELFEPVLDLSAMHWKEAVLERQCLHSRVRGPVQEIAGRGACFVLSLALSAQHAPRDVKAHTIRDPG